MSFAMQSCSQTDTTTRTDSKTSRAVDSNTAVVAKTTNHTEAEHAEDNAARINLAEAKKDFDNGNVFFIDTRAESAYKVEHIKGAVNIPVGDFENRYAEVPKDKKIIAYCSWPSEHTSARAVQILNEKGYKNAYALVGGTAAWKDAGYPMESAAAKK